ncbi:MAG TPA: o-succinylbenzoate synthase [Acidimicrobiales bacterium]|nr:o-succinylbenzoate synthase [Acidimicrobiales bacterium]
MRIRALEICRLDLVLLNALRTSVGEHGRRPVLIIRIITDEAEGFGECSALGEPIYTEEYSEAAEAVLIDYLIPRLMRNAQEELSLERRFASLDSVRGHPMAKAAIEMALLDAELRAKEVSLASYLGATQSSIPAGANISLGMPDEVIAAVAQTIDAGYRRVKCKIAPGQDLAVVREIRRSYPELVLSLDANGAYDYDNDEHRSILRTLDGFGLTAIEQPLAVDDLLGHARITRDLETPILLDESISTLGMLRIAIELGSCDGISVKPARVGGILTALKMHELCRAAGMHLAIGGMLETGIGRAAALAVGALPGFDLPGDLGGSERYFSPDLTLPHELCNGQLIVPDGPGIGVTPLENVIASARVRNRLFQTP